MKYLLIDFMKEELINQDVLYFTVSDSSNIYEDYAFINSFGVNGFVLEDDASEKEKKQFLSVYRPTVHDSADESIRILEREIDNISSVKDTLETNMNKRAYSEGKYLIFDIKTYGTFDDPDDLMSNFNEKEINELSMTYNELFMNGFLEELKGKGVENPRIDGRSGGWLVLEGFNDIPSIETLEEYLEETTERLEDIKSILKNISECMAENDFDGAIEELDEINSEYSVSRTESFIEDHYFKNASDIKEDIEEFEEFIKEQQSLYLSGWSKFLESILKSDKKQKSNIKNKI